MHVFAVARRRSSALGPSHALPALISLYTAFLRRRSGRSLSRKSISSTSSTRSIAMPLHPLELRRACLPTVSHKPRIRRSRLMLR